jgi:hypothetical protein
MSETERRTGSNFRIHMIYRADGMTRPLSYRQVVGAKSVTDALAFVSHFIGSAYKSGFEVLTWTAENLDKPVQLKYVGGELADEVARQREQSTGSAERG